MRRSQPAGRVVAPLAVTVVGLLLAACGAAVPPYLGQHSSASTPNASGSAGSSAGASSSAGSSSGSGAGSSSSNQGATGAGSSAGSSGGSSGGGGSAIPSAPSPTAPGTYHYNQSGSTTIAGSKQNVPAQGTIVVDAAAAQGPGNWTQVWHSAVDPSQPPTDTTFAIAPTGISVVSETIRMSGAGQSITYVCTFSTPMQVIAWPPVVGHSFSGTATCTQPSGNGSFTVHATGSISGTQATNDGGAATTAYVVTTHVTTSGQVTSTATENDWFDPALDLDLHQDTAQSGNYSGFVNFQSQITRDLVSTKPA